MLTAARNNFWLLMIGVGAASMSGAAVLLHAFANVHLASSTMVLAPASLVILLCAATWSKERSREIFVQRLAGGLFSGLMGLVAYDLLRWLILISGTVPFNPFRAIEVLGLLILNAPADTWGTRVAGWLFHIWNGLAFGVMYTLAVGRGRWWWAVIWSLALEGAMLSTYPSMFRMALDWPFITISVIGHLSYGLALGFTARGAIKE